VAAQFGDRDTIDRYANVVNPGTAGPGDLLCRRNKPVAQLARLDKGNIALRGNGAFVAGVAGKGKGRIRQQSGDRGTLTLRTGSKVSSSRSRASREMPLELNERSVNY